MNKELLKKVKRLKQIKLQRVEELDNEISSISKDIKRLTSLQFLNDEDEIGIDYREEIFKSRQKRMKLSDRQSILLDEVSEMNQIYGYENLK